MKKTLGYLLTLATLMGAGGFALANKSNKSEEVSASKSVHTTNMYERVEDIDRLENNDKVIIVIYENEVLSYFGGNGASAVFVTDGVYVSNDRKLIGLDNSQGTEFTLGYNSTTKEYTFRGTMEMTSDKTYDTLLAHVPYDTPTGFPGIGFFTGDRFGAYQYNSDNLASNKTHWKLTYSGNSQENIQMTNCYTSDCSRAYAIYRKTSKTFTDYSYDALYQNYYVGEDLNPEGFYVEVSDGLTDEYFKLYYQDNKSLFYFVGNGKAVANQTEYPIKLHGLNETFNFEINEPEDDYNFYYDYVTPAEHKDYRGRYLVVAQEEGRYYYKGRTPEYISEQQNSETFDFASEGRITNTGRVMYDNTVMIDKAYINGRYEYVALAQSDDGFPKYYVNPYYNDDETNTRFINTVSTITPTEENIIEVIPNTNGGITFGFRSATGRIYGFSFEIWEKAFFFETRDYYENARLYKINSCETFDNDIARFMQEFYNRTANCDASGHGRGIFDWQWQHIENEFNTMSEDAKGYLANLTYTHNAETPNTIEDVIDRYDFIISKYSDLKDFIDRKAVQTWNDTSGSSSTRPVVIDNVANTSSLILIIVVTSITSISLVGLFILKKKHTR